MSGAGQGAPLLDESFRLGRGAPLQIEGDRLAACGAGLDRAALLGQHARAALPGDRRMVREGLLAFFWHPLGVATGPAVEVGLLWYAMTLGVSLVGAPAFAAGWAVANQIYL